MLMDDANPLLKYFCQFSGCMTMTQLINKGGFRERANRSRKYKQSENEITTLPASHYRPSEKEANTSSQIEQPAANAEKQT